MTVTASQRSSGGYLQRPAPSSLADVIDSILDKGLVIDAYIRVSLVGIELLTIDARIVIASVDTYLRFAEATNRLDLFEKSRDLPEVIEDMSDSGARGKTRGLLGGARDALFGREENEDEDEYEDEEEPEEEPERPRRRSSSSQGRRRREEA